MAAINETVYREKYHVDAMTNDQRRLLDGARVYVHAMYEGTLKRH